MSNKKRKIDNISKIEELQKEYIYQREDYYSYHCGPFALYNLLLNYNIKMDIHELIKLCKPIMKDGTSNKKFNKAIQIINKKFNINIKETEASIDNIKKILKDNKQIIILFHWSDKYRTGEHFALIEKMIDENNFKFINYSFNKAIKTVKLKELQIMLKYFKSKNDICPTLWYNE